MAFATEDGVRARLRLTDTALAPQGLVLMAIADAHTVIGRWLDPRHGSGTPADGLALGETLLAGAYLLRSLAAKEAFDQKDVVVGGQRVASGNRFASLRALAAGFECQAWEALGPYLRDRGTRAGLDATPTRRVLGEG
ncbi:MAG TPA: hypothetical protein PLO62_10535 [Candidatus Hydrogenedentes bacterium]|nr:hypothetical protein [Candidatus Hydrogenedentota bacterium]HOS01432.1 hypothetical protein [Candidatus Hydrogenedentota bacterium]